MDTNQLTQEEKSEKVRKYNREKYANNEKYCQYKKDQAKLKYQKMRELYSKYKHNII
jgi:hypothetical protein